MQAVQFDEYGDPDVLHMAQVPEPHPGPGRIRVAVRAAGVNPIDWKIRSGTMQEMIPLTLPAIPGVEAAGVVDEVGEGVTDVAVGDEVFGFAVGGAAAEHAVLDDYAVKPAGLDWAHAAGLPMAVETTFRVLRLLGLQSGQTLLVNGAAGGVGTVAVQIARAEGATVIGTASDGNHEFLRSLGVMPTTYGPGLPDRVKEVTPEGVDLAFDVVGHGVIPDLVEITGSPDRVVTIADFSAPEQGVRVTDGSEGRAEGALAEAARLIEAGQLALPAVRTFPLAEAGAAQRISEDGHVRGKLALVVG